MSENISPASVAPVAPKIVVPSETVDLVRGSLATNSVGRASVEFYRATLAAAGVDPDSLSFEEAIEVSRRLYGPSADFRRSAREVEAAKREKVAAEKAKARDAAKIERAKAEKARLEKLLAKYSG